MRKPASTPAAILIFLAALSCATPAPAQATQPDKDPQITELTERVAELERRLTELEEQALPLIEQALNQQRRDKAKAAARARMRRDRGKYSPEILGQVEQLINDYPDLNRTGCATLYLGQMTQGPEKVDHLTRAMTDFPDCYYGNGVNVGAYATYQLACYHWTEGNYEDAQQLIDNINSNHPDAIDHRGRPLTELLSEFQQTPPGPANQDPTAQP